jgi:cyclohexa-1,5-dienecarbonyl-CoA hydratase
MTRDTTNENRTVQARIEGRIAWITLNRPPLNIFDISMMRELNAALDSVLPRCNFVVLQGHGPKAFSAGAEVGDHLPERVQEMLGAFHGVFRRLARADCVTIAAVHGHCLGGGMELATFCDFVLADESAKFGQPEIKLACFPPIAMITFPQLCGLRAALDLILTGRTIPAEEAWRLGLVSRIEKGGEVQQGARKLIEELSVLSPDVLRLTRRTLWKLHADDFERQLDEVEQIYFDQLMRTDDASEGIHAFMERRAPVWQKR